VSDYLLSVLIRIGIEAFVALSAYLLLLMGRISFGQQGFFAVGAYAGGMATALGGAPLAAGLAVGAAVAAMLGLLAALPLVPRRGLAFAAGSLALGELCRIAFLALHYQVPVGPDLVGPAGADGFRGIRLLFTSGLSLPAYAAAIYGLLGLTLVGAGRALRSRWGEALRLIGQDEVVAATAGVRVARVRVAAMALSGGLAGLGGALFAHYATYVEPGHADVMLGVHSLAYGVIGGLGTPLGPALGVALDVGVLESFRVLSGYRMILFGGLVAVLLIVRPRGILDEATVRRLTAAGRRWRQRG
jgi:branched-chain amino acid transport system permease protein